MTLEHSFNKHDRNPAVAGFLLYSIIFLVENYFRNVYKMNILALSWRGGGIYNVLKKISLALSWRMGLGGLSSRVI